MERGLRFGNVGKSLVLLLLMLRAVSASTVQFNSLSRTELETADTVMEHGLESSIGDATVEDDENSAAGESEDPAAGDNDTNVNQHAR
ncbi:eukaryotic translation initiation factor 2-alpha kinase 3 [Tachysurus ichikawai]